MASYLQEEWAMQLSSKDKKTSHQDAVEKQLRSERDSLLKENKQIRKCSNVLQYQVNTLSVQLQKACSSGYQTSQPENSYNRETTSLEPSFEQFTPCNYTLDVEPTFMRAQKCPSYLGIHVYSVLKCIFIPTTS